KTVRVGTGGRGGDGEYQQQGNSSSSLHRSTGLVRILDGAASGGACNRWLAVKGVHRRQEKFSMIFGSISDNVRLTCRAELSNTRDLPGSQGAQRVAPSHERA